MNVTKKQAFEWMDEQIVLRKLLTKPLLECDIGGIRCIDVTIERDKEIHISGIKKLADIIDYPLVINVWEGNESCKSDFVEAKINYAGYTFFELLSRNECEGIKNDG